MAVKSSIQWTHASWNPWTGCHKVSSGCKFCYMMRDKEKYGKNGDRVFRSKTTFYDPLKWKEPKLIFTSSWTDIFIEEGDKWREEVWSIIKRCPQHHFQILTKRPERIKDHLPADWGEGYQNVWLGVSVENQKAFEFRVPILMSIPANVRFLSCEPLLMPIDLNKAFYIDYPGSFFDGKNDIHWVIIGGESGNENGKWLYRSCGVEWMESIVDDCNKAEVPVFVKQMGTFISHQLQMKDRHGSDFDEFPPLLQKREFPKSYKP
jgi:protein gp37